MVFLLLVLAIAYSYLMEQQEQTQKYFDLHASDWNEQSKKTSYNTIADRNWTVIDSCAHHGQVKDFLDVGCGSGQLVIQIAEKGVNSIGIDFAPEMIRVSQDNAKNLISNATFKQCSVFDYQCFPNSFDLVSAQGFIEYISESELNSFIDFCGRSLRPNGVAVIGSRNRLFNVISMNGYTEMELKLGTLTQLIEESTLIQNTETQNSLFEVLNNTHFASRHPVSHPFTGVSVTTRFQYTPSELIAKFKTVGLAPQRIYPINFQPIPQSLLAINEWAKVKDQIASLISKSPRESHQFVPFSSSFVLALKKLGRLD
jgi:2-polyprenyl-3-methyl-5-hydroxy-6-metoxy-1,4-benzoquinol methylase